MIRLITEKIASLQILFNGMNVFNFKGTSMFGKLHTHPMGLEPKPSTSNVYREERTDSLEFFGFSYNYFLQ